jgi:hypothetical protein
VCHYSNDGTIQPHGRLIQVLLLQDEKRLLGWYSDRLWTGRSAHTRAFSTTCTLTLEIVWPLMQWVPVSISPANWSNGRNAKLTTHLRVCLVPRWRKEEPYLHTPPRVVMAQWSTDNFNRSRGAWSRETPMVAWGPLACGPWRWKPVLMNYYWATPERCRRI